MPINLGKAAGVVGGLYLSGLGLLVTTPARGYDMIGTACGGAHWASGSYTFRTSTTDFPSAGTPHQAVESAIQMWNAGSGQDIRGGALAIVHGAHTTITTHDGSDGFNSVTDEVLAAGVLGLTVFDYNHTTCEMDHSDIILDPDGSWQVYPVIYNGDLSYSTVSLHEAGHAVGIDHEDETSC